jgi:tellurium resistance protein TerD
MYFDTRNRPNRLLWSRSYNYRARALARAHGGWRKLIALAGELPDRLWELIAEPEWRDPDTSVLWEVAALAEDWAVMSNTSMLSQWTLVTAAVGDRQLVLTPKVDGNPRVRVVSPVPEHAGRTGAAPIDSALPAGSLDHDIPLRAVQGRLHLVDVAFGWQVAPGLCTEFDIDASAIGCGADGRAVGHDYYVHFNNLRSPCGGIQQLGDQLIERGMADDDLMRVSFQELDPAVHEIVFVLTIYDADSRRQSYEQIIDAYVRISGGDGADLVHYRPDDLIDGTAVVVCSMRRDRDNWVFHPIAKRFPSGLVGITREYGLPY